MLFLCFLSPESRAGRSVLCASSEEAIPSIAATSAGTSTVASAVTSTSGTSSVLTSGTSPSASISVDMRSEVLVQQSHKRPFEDASRHFAHLQSQLLLLTRPHSEVNSPDEMGIKFNVVTLLESETLLLTNGVLGTLNADTTKA